MSNEMTARSAQEALFAAYGAELVEAFRTLTQHSDDVVARCFGRLTATVNLLLLKSEAVAPVTYARSGAGLPLLAEIIALNQAMAAKALPPVSSDRMREGLLDEMLVRRRMPRPLQLREISKAHYLETLSGAGAIFGSEAVTFTPVSDQGYMRVAWDHWDGPSSTPVHSVAWFQHQGPEPFPAEILKRVARRVSGAAFTPLAAAIEFDDATPTTRLKKLVRMPVGPFRAPAFTELDGPLAGILAEADVDEKAFALTFHVDVVVSSGSRTVGAGWFSKGIQRETFAVDKSDALSTERGASISARHVLVPHGIYQRVQDQLSGDALAALGRASIHALTRDGGLIEAY